MPYVEKNKKKLDPTFIPKMQDIMTNNYIDKAIVDRYVTIDDIATADIFLS
jgi:hypothetical protein